MAVQQAGISFFRLSRYAPVRSCHLHFEARMIRESEQSATIGLSVGINSAIRARLVTLNPSPTGTETGTLANNKLILVEDYRNTRS